MENSYGTLLVKVLQERFCATYVCVCVCVCVCVTPSRVRETSSSSIITPPNLCDLPWDSERLSAADALRPVCVCVCVCV